MIVRARNLTLSFVIIVIFVIFLAGNLFKTAYFAISEITKSPTAALHPILYCRSDACFVGR